MKIRYSYRKKKKITGYKYNNNIDNIVNNRDVSTDYDNTAYELFLFLRSVGIIFHCCFIICSCFLRRPAGSKERLFFVQPTKPERLIPQLLFFCFI